MATNKVERLLHKHPLQAICPYFAMFPEEFAEKNIRLYSKEKDWILDPFCGRGTTVFEALLLGRKAAGSDINPVAYCITAAKASRRRSSSINGRIDELEKKYNKSSKKALEKKRRRLPPFFRRAFYFSTLHEILFLQHTLRWECNHIDRFIAALVLGSLHGEMDKSSSYFSNQMPRTICLKPDYSLRYWRSKGLFPKKRCVFNMLRQKAKYRLHGLPSIKSGKVKIMDARKAYKSFRFLKHKVSLVVTSPPYLNVTRYEEDQWLRLWFLGYSPRPTAGKISTDDRHESKEKYWQFLSESWAGIKPLLKSNAKIVIRLGAIGINEREMTIQLKKSITSVFPKAYLLKRPYKTEMRGRQAKNFMPKSKGCLFEKDYVFAISMRRNRKAVSISSAR